MDDLEVPTFGGEEVNKDLYHAEFLVNNDLWVPYVKAVCQKHSLPVNNIKGKIHTAASYDRLFETRNLSCPHR
jgi:hypothetical protein